MLRVVSIPHSRVLINGLPSLWPVSLKPPCPHISATCSCYGNQVATDPPPSRMKRREGKRDGGRDGCVQRTDLTNVQMDEILISPSRRRVPGHLGGL